MREIIAVLLTVILNVGFAQSRINGVVTDEKGVPVPGANVFLAGTYDGTTTDANGKFDFISAEAGDQLLVAKFVGYRQAEVKVVLAGKAVLVNITLKEEVSELAAVTITAGSFTASDESRRTIFRALDIATTAGATADIAGALNTLPGTQKVGESGRLFVRGGDGHEARTFIDGLLVLDAYNATAPNTPSRGRFLPFMFKGTSFSTGGYSAEFGQALSSALALDSKDKDETTRTDVGLLSVGADVSHTHAWDKASWAGKVQYTNIRPYFGLINQEIDWKTPPAAIEGSTAFRQQVGESGLLKVYGNFNHASFSLYNHPIDGTGVAQLYDLTNNYRYINTAYKNALGDKWFVRGGFSYTSLRNDVSVEQDDFIETEKGWHAKTVFEGTVSEGVELKAGLEIIDRDYNQRTVFENGPQADAGFREVITAGFVEGDMYASNKFVTRAGARWEYNNLLNNVSVDPRLSFAYKAGENGSVSLAYGTFRQSPQNKLLRDNSKLQPEKSAHYIASYQLVENNRTLRVEAYYKRYRDLVRYAGPMGAELDNSGKGYARGVELFWRDNRTFKNTDFWISYSYLDTKRLYLQFPYEAVPAFASAHNFSIVYKYFFTKLKTQFGTTYSFASGRPYNDPNEESFNASRTPNYHDVSLNLAYLPKPHLIIYFSTTNLFGRDNIFGYEFSESMNDSGVYASRAIRQPAPRFVFLGIFITLPKEKGMNQLPSL